MAVPLLAEQRELERTIVRIRWGAVALILLLGPLFPSLSLGAVVGLGIVVGAYNVGIARLSAAAADVAAHRRVAMLGFAADLAATCVAMLLFSNEPYWTTFVVAPLVIIGAAFRFGGVGAYVSAAVLGAAYVAISVIRLEAFGLELAPQRVLFHLAVFALSARLVDRVDRDIREARAEREALIGSLQRQIAENERLFAEASEAKALRELDRLKDEFLAAVSHELRTPLTVISGSLELLAREGERLSPQASRLIERAEAHTRRLDRSVEDLLELAQLQEARIELQKEFVAPRELLADAAATHEPLASARRQRVVVTCADDVPPILVDRRRMQQIVGNLLQNATRYAPEGTAIEARVDRTPDAARISVSDHGPGVPAAERERIFDKFYRGERTKTTTSGSGLGLAIARTLVELHGGRIRVEDAPAGGARFVVEIPYEAVSAPAG
ncbi:MAG: hypothetical protein KGN00_12965 [Chloroflexota bacterium]|nr:hypothetical protein [Chloroflexota bacterium]MDE3194584.1 hypothetical protein [Chloroflexota bacterium]